MDVDQLLALLASATPEQFQTLREMVAPITKLQRLQSESQELANKNNMAVSRANDVVSRFSQRANNGDLTAVCPTWDEVVTAFRGE
jgi:hypothetical protein